MAVLEAALGSGRPVYISYVVPVRVACAVAAGGMVIGTGGVSTCACARVAFNAACKRVGMSSIGGAATDDLRLNR